MLNLPVADFTCLTDKGEPFTLSSLKGKTVVLYFYPRDDTPGCTVEAQDFTAQHAAFAPLNAVVLGISRDTVKSHQKFCTKYSIPFTLLADPEETICNQFAVMKQKNMYGKQVRGIERSTFIINPDGLLVHEWRKVKIEGHVDEVLTYLRQ
jgi:thioredoxin-dependent peroxiredoxin